ncbi:MAG: phosphoglycerate kinase [Candidatus Micrarchaeota archaeon]|nr:phosphoglycerate kinase [Candidatus Micrarchaeota archaeon]
MPSSRKSKNPTTVLDKLDLKSKYVFVRVDLNSPIVNRKVELSARIVAHAETLKYLAKRKAKVVVLAHQGRKGDEDFTDLSQHYELLKPLLKRQKFYFVNDVVGEKAVNAVKSLKEGEILLLDNVRLLDDEKSYDTPEQCLNSQLVKTYENICDIFVLDAFSVSHRNQPSVTGFFRKGIIPGLILERELNSIDKMSKVRDSALFVLGGAKAEDGIKIMEHWINKLGGKAKFLLGGSIANVFLLARGYKVGKGTEEFLAKNNNLQLVDKAKELLTKAKDNIIIPEDVAVEENNQRKEYLISSVPEAASILDIGSNTITKYESEIMNAESILVNGPVGVYEDVRFELGTKRILTAISKAGKAKKAFSLIGGGHTVSAIEKFKLNKKTFGYISLAGKALIQYLCGEKLAGIELLKR